MIKIDKASKFDEGMVRTGMATNFSDGFTQWLTFFSKDPKKIAAAFKHIFILERFFVAVDDNRVVGMVACTNTRELSVRLNGKDLRKYLGWYKGSLALLFLKKEFEAPLKLSSENTASIEFVGTASNYTGKGIATQIMNYLFENTKYQTYLIEEVADNNTPAMNLYKKLGFTEYKRRRNEGSKKNGISYFISLKYEKRKVI